MNTSRLIKHLSFVILLITLLIASQLFYVNNIEVPVHKIKESKDLQELVFDRWRAVGPFVPDSVEMDSGKVKIPEIESVFNSRTMELFPTGIRNKLMGFHTNRLVSDTSGFFDFRGSLSIVKEPDKGTVGYFVSSIVTGSEMEVYLAIQGKGEYNIFINGELCLAGTYTHFKHMFPQYQYFKKVKLQQGKNLVILECTKRYKNVQLFFKMAILSRKQASHYFSIFLNTIDIIPTYLNTPDNDSLKVSNELLEYGFDSIIVSGKNGNLAISFDTERFKSQKAGELNIPYSSEPYKVECWIDSISCHQNLFYGDLNEFYKYYYEQAENLEIYNSDKNFYINPLLTRFENLSKRTDTNSRLITRKKEFVLTKLETIFNHIHSDNELPVLEGINIHGFVSDIDDQVRNYLVIAPDSIKPYKRYPVIFEIHYGYDNNHAFNVGHILNLNFYRHCSLLVNTFDIIIVLSPLRLYKREEYFPPVSESEFFNVFNDVSKHYNLDYERLYLYGACGGARRAVLFSESFPDLFSGLIIGGLAGNSDTETPKKFDIIERISNLSSLHVFSQHDKIDTHSPYLYAKDFLVRLESQNEHFSQTVTDYNRHFQNRVNDYQLVNMINKRKINYCPELRFKSWRRKTNKIQWIHDITMDSNGEFFEINGKVKNRTIWLNGTNIHSFSIHLDEIPIDEKNEKILIFYNGENKDYNYLPGKRKIIVEVTKKDRTNNYPFLKNQFVEGPVWEVFGGSFIFIRGHIKPELWASSCDSLINRWNNYFHTDIRPFNDLLNDSLLSQNNLILFGNTSTNNIIEEISGFLPLKTYLDSVILGDQSYNSPYICYQYCFPNPFNPEKYILIIGANNMKNFLLYQVMPWFEGTSDFYIWSSENGKAEIIAKGNFDYKWDVCNRNPTIFEE